MNPRARASQLLVTVLQQGRSLTEALAEISEKETHRALVQELCFGVLRWFWPLQNILKNFVTSPLKKSDFDIHIILLLGLYQLIYLRIPPHAAVSETVNATRDLKKPWAAKLVNAVMRNAIRQLPNLSKEPQNNIEAQYSHPDWLIKKIKTAWPNNWELILRANNERAPLTLRVNQQQISRQAYLNLLAQEQLNKNILSFAQDDIIVLEEPNTAIVLKKPCPVTSLPNFDKGMISIQDAGAQFAAPLLDLQSGLRILDACAAPGGKLTHILEINTAGSDITAIDENPLRVKKIQQNLTRLNLSAKIITADAAATNLWWDKKYFDRILLDVPCSATGVIRRHPDIKHLRRKEDISALQIDQKNLLQKLWQLLGNNGILLYVTCSVLPAENEEIIADFLQQNRDAEEIKIEASWGIARKHGRQILPGENYCDGFYYAKLRKI